jgi:hypothetical protein
MSTNEHSPLIERLDSVVLSIQSLKALAQEAGLLPDDSPGDALERAYRTLGMKSPRAARAEADRARQAYELLRDSGARPQELHEGFYRYTELEYRARQLGVLSEEALQAIRTEANARGLTACPTIAD